MLSNSAYLGNERRSPRRASRSLAIDDLLSAVATRHDVLDLSVSDAGGLLIGSVSGLREAECAAALAPAILEAGAWTRAAVVRRQLAKLSVAPNARVLVGSVRAGDVTLLVSVTSLAQASGEAALGETGAGLVRILTELAQAA